MPSSTIITVDGVTFTGALPQAEYDPVVVPGTLAVYRAKNPRSWPLQAAPTASVRSWLNLVRGGAAADLSTDFTWGPNGGFVRSNGAASRINLGVIDFTTHAIAALAWVKFPTIPAAYTPILSRLASTGAAANNQFGLAIGSDGKLRLDLIYLDTDGTTMRYSTISAPAVMTAGVHQVGFQARNTGANATDYSLFIDGVQVANAQYIGAKLNPSTYAIALGDRNVGNGGGAGAVNHVYYAALIEDLTVSGRSGLTAVQADYAAFNGKFS